MWGEVIRVLDRELIDLFHFVVFWYWRSNTCAPSSPESTWECTYVPLTSIGVRNWLSLQPTQMWGGLCLRNWEPQNLLPLLLLSGCWHQSLSCECDLGCSFRHRFCAPLNIQDAIPPSTSAPLPLVVVLPHFYSSIVCHLCMPSLLPSSVGSAHPRFGFGLAFARWALLFLLFAV